METALKIQLVAHGSDLYQAWSQQFAGCPDVAVQKGDILSWKADAIVSPANSFGYMDGGLDLKYSEYFGWGLESRLRRLLVESYFGELTVGQAVVVETEHEAIPYLISAPTMRVPMNVADTVNAYLAFRGVLAAVIEFNRTQPGAISSLLCPGLCTGEGKMSPQRCATQMYKAYEVCIRRKIQTKGGLAQAVREHMDLVK